MSGAFFFTIIKEGVLMQDDVLSIVVPKIIFFHAETFVSKIVFFHAETFKSISSIKCILILDGKDEGIKSFFFFRNLRSVGPVMLKNIGIVINKKNVLFERCLQR